MAIYQVSWYVVHMGRMTFYVQSSGTPTKELKAKCFNKWAKQFVDGASKEERERIIGRLVDDFHTATIGKVKVVND